MASREPQHITAADTSVKKELGTSDTYAKITQVTIHASAAPQQWRRLRSWGQYLEISRLR